MVHEGVPVSKEDVAAARAEYETSTLAYDAAFNEATNLEKQIAGGEHNSDIESLMVRWQELNKKAEEAWQVHREKLIALSALIPHLY